MRRARLGPVLLLAACADGPPVPPADPAAPALSVLTYNVNYERLDVATVDAIAAADADLVLLQETNAWWEREVRARLADRYPTILFRAHEPDGGMGVLSRHPVRDLAWRPSPVGMFPAWCLAVDAPSGPVDVLALHLHPPLDEGGLLTGYFTTGDARLAEVSAHLGCFPEGPDLVAGDLNEEEGDAVDHLFDAGLRDAAGAFPPPTRTWRWQLDWTELTGRPDHVFHGRGWVPEAVAVEEAGASDHRPLRVALRRIDGEGVR